MKKTIITLSFCILLQFLNTRASGQELPEDLDPVEARLISLSVDFFKHMASSEYSNASVLFHYPKEYTSEKKAEQILDVSKLLKVFTDEFGFPSNHKVDMTSDLYYNVAVSGGDTSYWENHPSYVEIPLRVNFSKEQNGHVVILFSNILDKWEIRAVAYGLPVKRPGAKERAVEIMTKMLITLQPEIQKTPTKDKYPIFLASND